LVTGLEFALMEAYLPGRTENLRGYLVPTIGDAPEIECLPVEDAEPAGPYGAKGVGEPAVVPTAPAFLGAIRDATGAQIAGVPATPDRVRAAILRARWRWASRGPAGEPQDEGTSDGSGDPG
jgi:CO/xanthine dehydrogenase Mo-binding subunit